MWIQGYASLGFVLELFEAHAATEVVVLPSVFALVLRGAWVHFHMADRILGDNVWCVLRHFFDSLGDVGAGRDALLPIWN